MLTKKVEWIAQELGEDGDDVLDMLLGNITKPRSKVDAVKAAALRYDNERERKLGEGPLHSKEGSFEARFRNY